MNYILSFDKKFILFFFIIFVILCLCFLFFKNIDFKNNIIVKNNIVSNYDIINPKFTINNNNNNITISAKEGNFINDNKILLKNEVIFKSKKFKIQSSEVFFDKNKKTAYSKNKAVFSTKKTRINSNGFEIKDNGNLIIFNGKTKVKINK